MPDYFTELKNGPSGPSYKVKDEEAHSSIETLVNDVSDIKEALAEKADTDDIPDLVSDNLAKGILGNETVLSTDTVPFVSKIMGAGKYQRKKFVGCSFVWNQLVDANYKTKTIPANTSNIVNLGWSTNLIANHRYLMTWTQTVTMQSATRNTPTYIIDGVRAYYSTGENINLAAGNYFWRFSPTTSGTAAFGYWVNTSVEQTIDNINLIDLTQMFGTTIADYVYSLELAEEGSGIAKLKELGFFTEDYYAYDAGSIQSVDIKEYAVTGKNLLDMQLFASINTTVNGNVATLTATANFASSARIMVKKPKNTTLRLSWTSSDTTKGRLEVIYKDKNGMQIGGTQIAYGGYTIPDDNDIAEIGILLSNYIKGAGTFTFENVQLELGSTETAYEPYHKTTYPLTPTELRGVPKIDANNNIYCDGDEYASDGTVTRNYDIVDMGSLTWQYSDAEYPFFYTNPLFFGNDKDYILPKYSKVKAMNGATFGSTDTGDKCFCPAGSSGTMKIKDFTYTDVTEFTASLSGVYLVYKKATTTTETLTPFDYPQSVGSLEEITDYKVEQEDRDVAIPTGHVTEYMGKGGEFALPTLPDSPSVLAFDGHNFFWKPETT